MDKKPTISDEERAQRESHINQALAIVRLEGQCPGPHVLAVYDKYKRGDISYNELEMLIHEAALEDLTEQHAALNKQFPTD